jgi:hypothetical protein
VQDVTASWNSMCECHSIHRFGLLHALTVQ